MHRNPISLAILLALMQVSCMNDQLTKRIELMEKEIVDQQRNTQRLETRIDELQIQLTVISRKIDQKATSSAQEYDIPELSIYRLAPQEAPADVSKSPRSSAKRSNSKRKLNKNRSKTNLAGNQRLAVDQQAAKRPILPLTGSPSKEFEQAFNLFRSNELQKAIAALNRFAKDYPQHTMARDALYYSAKAQMMLGKMDQAEKRFLELAKIHPNYSLSADALLLAGTCQERQGRMQEARSTYLQLVDAYPLSDPASEANRRLKAIR